MMFRPILTAGAAAIAAVVLGAGPALGGTAQASSAAGSWSAPVALPAGAGTGGFAENASGAQIAVTGSGPQVSTSAKCRALMRDLRMDRVRAGVMTMAR